MKRRLLVTRRLVPLDRLEDYREEWEQLRDAVHQRGGRAWLFRATDHEDRFLEFVEWDDDALPGLPEDEPISAARESLGFDFGAAGDDEWEETGLR